MNQDFYHCLLSAPRKPQITADKMFFLPLFFLLSVRFFRLDDVDGVFVTSPTVVVTSASVCVWYGGVGAPPGAHGAS